MIQRFDTGIRLSEMTIHNGTVYLSGQIADDCSADARGQTRQVLAAIDGLLARAGTDKSRLLHAQIFLPDLGSLSAMNEVWENWVVPGHAPTRTTVQATLADPRWKIEIVVTAAV
ncbi:MAG TPA: RidA family protein [Pseudoxanthomonas sp.]|nr:RidA family protein [Pseudoxanthomonas sp.]